MNTEAYGDALDGALGEISRLGAENKKLREAVVLLLRNFPTDGDLREAGWEDLEIESACSAYDTARQSL
jgi:hypothetical protein